MDGTRAIQELFGEKVFPFSKPVELLHQLLDQATHPDSIVLDFFAGSGTTAQAVLELNKKDGGDRKFILIQLPEPTGITSYPTISEIAKERVRRVVRRLNEEEARNLPLENVGRLNRGFRSFKLAESNFQAWIPQTSNDPTQLVQQLEMHVEHIRGDRSAEDILTEVLLKSGFPLAIKVQRLSLYERDVYSVSDGAMLVCLEKNLTPELINAIADMKPQRVICLDEGFAGNDQLKTNAVQTMKSKGVTSFRTV